MAETEGTAASHSQNTLLYIFALLYLAVLVGIAVLAYQRKKAASSAAGKLEGHFGGSFSAPVLVLTTFSSVYSGFTVTGIPSEAYRKGFFSLRWIGATLVIVVAMLLFYPRLRRLSIERKYQSPNDFVSDRYRDARLRILCAACSVVPLLIYLTAQIVSFAAMVSGLTLQAVPKWASMVGFSVFTLVLEKLGGMNSVVLTDAVQSVVMIAAFLVVPWVLGADFGFLADFASADCSSLIFVARNASNADALPGECPAPAQAGGPVAPGCVPAGCLAAVRPEFYEYPSRADQAQIFWFFFNMLGAALQPHMVQRAYIAASDRALKVVMAAMLVAPFLAQPPGIVIGLTKAAFEPAWPEADREATAFSSVSNQLMARGALEYFLVTTMTCSTLAAIMSTADSALMGASSVVSIDIFKGWLMPSASTDRIVQVGELNSLLMMTGAVLLGLNLSVSQFGSLIVFQNGMLMQLLPTFGLGLYFNMRAIALVSGMAVGLVVLVILAACGNPADPYIPLVNVSFLVNFLVVAAVQAFTVLRGGEGSDPPGKSHEDGVDFHEQAPLSLADIKSAMAASREPNKPILLAMLALMVLAVPLYRTPGSAETLVLGLPMWGLIQCLLFVVVFLLGQWVTCRWIPGGRHSGNVAETSDTDTDAQGSSASSTEETSED